MGSPGEGSAPLQDGFECSWGTSPSDSQIAARGAHLSEARVSRPPARDETGPEASSPRAAELPVGIARGLVSPIVSPMGSL